LAALETAGIIIARDTTATRTALIPNADLPVVPDFKRFPETGRDQSLTTGEVGLAGHWIKHLLHYAFLWKAKLRPLWTIIPE